MERDRRGRLPWTIVLLVTALACGVALLGTFIFSAPRRSVGTVSYEVVQLDGVSALETVSDGFVYYDGGSITKVDAEGDTVWSCMVGGGAEFCASDAGAASWIDKRLTLIEDSTGTTSYTGNMDGEIISARMGGKYTAVLLGPEHNSTIVLMETEGRKVDSITLSDQTVIDYGFFYNDTLFWVMLLDTNGTVPSCTINTYNPGRRIAGSITDSDQLFYHVLFQSSQISCVGDTYIKSYTYTGQAETGKRNLVYGWTLADAHDSGDNPLMAFVPNGQNDGAQPIKDVRMVRGGADQTVRLPYGCASLVAWNDSVYGFSNDGYVMVVRMGQQKASAKQLGLRFDNVYGVMDGGVAVLGSGNLIYLVRLG